MSILDETLLTSNVSVFKLHLELEGHDISGILMNEHYGFFLPFQGVRDFFTELDAFFDYVNFPMSSTQQRSFEHREDRPALGKLPSIRPLSEMRQPPQTPDFLLHIQFRRGSTWQGTLHWLSRNKVTRFRSERELVNLMLSALEQREETGRK